MISSVRGNVSEVVKEALVDFADEGERVVAAPQVQLGGKSKERGSFHGEGTGKKHLPVVARADGLIEFSPGVGAERVRDMRDGLLLNDGLGDDDELVVLAGDIEVMDVVAEVVA